jgi:hypothetical protein
MCIGIVCKYLQLSGWDVPCTTRLASVTNPTDVMGGRSERNFFSTPPPDHHRSLASRVERKKSWKSAKLVVSDVFYAVGICDFCEEVIYTPPKMTIDLHIRDLRADIVILTV